MEAKEIIHVIGNGDLAMLYTPAKGLKIVCNMPAFAIENVYATCMVDYKMMACLHEGNVKLDMYSWVLGTRPRHWMEMKPDFYMRYAHCIKEFYQTVPKYAGNATNFNCGHMAVHYSANKLKGKQIHMYGFDTLFDFNIRSSTDTYLNSDRSNQNNYRLIGNWRPIWPQIFKEFKNTEFILYHNHDDLKIDAPDNVKIQVRDTKTKKNI